MKNPALLSIVVPTYNQGPYIAQCLRSIAQQSYPHLQVIIQDSESTDETEAICRDIIAADTRFEYYKEKDAGQSDGINRGLQRARGDLWTWICSDDYYSDLNALGALVAELETAAPEVVGAYGDACYVDEGGKILGSYENATRTLRRDDFKLTWPLSQPSSILKTVRVREVGGVRADLHLGMDLDLMLKVLQGNSRLHYVRQSVASIRIQPNSKSVKFRIATAQNALDLIKQHFGDIGDPLSSIYLRELYAALAESSPHSFPQRVKKVWSSLRPLVYRIYAFPGLRWIPHVAVWVKPRIFKWAVMLDALKASRKRARGT